MTCKQVEAGKLVLEKAEFNLGRELEGLIDMFSVQCINHHVETLLDLSGMNLLIHSIEGRCITSACSLIPAIITILFYIQISTENFGNRVALQMTCLSCSKEILPELFRYLQILLVILSSSQRVSASFPILWKYIVA